MTSDTHGNVHAREGVDRCACGCKYWERDHCIDCDARNPRAPLRVGDLLALENPAGGVDFAHVVVAVP